MNSTEVNVTEFLVSRALRKSKFQWNATGAAASMCRKARVQFGLVRRQTKLCRSTTQAMPQIVRAAQETVATCQTVFADRRWNCSSIETAPNFTPDITTGGSLLSSLLAYLLSDTYNSLEGFWSPSNEGFFI